MGELGILREFEDFFDHGGSSFAGDPSPWSIGEFLEELHRANLEYLIETDSEVPSCTTMPETLSFKGIEGFTADQAAWKSLLEAKMSECLDLWEKDAEAESQELLASLDGD
jgi:hypothetical protein